MSFWRKASATDTGSHNINGWVKINSIWRKASATDTGAHNINGWVRIKSIWRLASSGLWEKIFGTGIPNAETGNPPTLTFISPDGFESIDSPFNGDKMYLTRGEWNEEPTKFTMYIQKSSPPYSSWTDLITPVVKEYAEYSNSDASFQVPVNASNRPLISKTNVYNKVKFRGKVKAENSAGEADLNFPPLGIAARYFFNIQSFEITDETETSVNLSWTYDPSTITISDIPTYMYSQQIQLYNSAGQPQLPYKEVVSLLETSTVINIPNNLNQDDSYQWELSIIADDYYRDFTGTRYSSSGPTEELAYIDWQPGIIDDPTITFSNRTKESFSVEWFSANATSYKVDIKRNSTGASLSGYPVTTTNTSAILSGLTINALYNVSVTALGGNAYPPKESNTITESIRTLNLGVQAMLSKAYDATSTSFKVEILNYQDISTFDISINCTNGNASRSSNIIYVSGVSSNSPSCVSVTTSKINNSDLTAFSYDYETSVEVCETPGTWYCVTYVQGPPITCFTSTSTTNISGNGSGYATACYVTPSCCVKTEYGEWSPYTECINGKRTRTRQKTEYFLNCTSTTSTETSPEENCWFCTQSVQSNCAGCITTIESSNISSSGSGYSISCSQSGYPSCGTPCVCDSTKESQCGTWGPWGSCTGSAGSQTRTRTRTCPVGSPCATSQTEPCWYCTTSVQSNCAGCPQSIEGSNISGSGSGYSISCSRTSYPACQTPCVCDSTKDGQCGSWTYSSCSGSPPTRTKTRTCPAGSPCATSVTESCWYCTTSISGSNCAGCPQSIETSNISSSGSGYSISCSQSGYPSCGTPCVCDSTKESQCGAWTCGACSGGSRTCTRTCPGGSPCITSKTEQCWYCTTSVNVNCEGCAQSFQTSNISGSGSGYSISCSQTSYPACQTPCVCDSTKDGQCGAWSAWSACSGGTRTRTRICPSGSPCSTSQTETCWYCTTSVNVNCAGCSQSIEGSNISGSGSGYSISCSTSGYPTCQTPCVSTQWWCRTINDNTGSCSLTGPFTNDQTSFVGGIRTVCTTGTSNPYTCPSAINTIATINTIDTSINTIATIDTIATINTIATIDTIATINTIATIDTGGGGCHVFGTQIEMSDGTWKNIEDLYVGDEVMAADIPGLLDNEFDSENLEMWSSEDLSQTSKTTAVVTNVFIRSYGQYYVINDTINITYEHIIPAQKNGVWKFIAVEDLNVGDNIMNDNLEVVEVYSKDFVSNRVETASINIETKDLYFVKGLMAHNLNPDKQIPS